MKEIDMNNKACDQGAFVWIYKKNQLMLMAFSLSSQGVRLSGHSKLQKHPMDAPDAEIGASVRLCINNRKPGHYVPHMYKEREAYLEYRKAFLKDRGVESDTVFNKHLEAFDIYLWPDRIEYQIYDEETRIWSLFKVLPLTASDEELGQTLKQAYQHISKQ